MKATGAAAAQSCIRSLACVCWGVSSDLQSLCRKGAFGSVYKQVLDSTREVAVKHLGDTVGAASIKSFASEVSIMHGCRCSTTQQLPGMTCLI